LPAKIRSTADESSARSARSCFERRILSELRNTGAFGSTASCSLPRTAATAARLVRRW